MENIRFKTIIEILGAPKEHIEKTVEEITGIPIQKHKNEMLRLIELEESLNKEVVGQFAARTRASRKPEPYKGKCIRYEGEIVRRKQGKKAVT